jgi:hypothetical protein
MGPKSRHHAAEQDLFRMELVNLIDQRHELIKLASLIDWAALEQAWGPKFESTTGRPALPTRLMASLLYLKHTFALSDEDVVERWIENPYWQHFSGERYFRHELPCDPSSLVRWRQRIGEEGCEWLLEHSIKAAMSAGVVKRQSLDTVVVDTTVQPKAIAHPTDSRQLNRARPRYAGCFTKGRPAAARPTRRCRSRPMSSCCAASCPAPGLFPPAQPRRRQRWLRELLQASAKALCVRTLNQQRPRMVKRRNSPYAPYKAPRVHRPCSFEPCISAPAGRRAATAGPRAVKNEFMP